METDILKLSIEDLVINHLESGTISELLNLINDPEIYRGVIEYRKAFRSWPDILEPYVLSLEENINELESKEVVEIGEYRKLENTWCSYIAICTSLGFMYSYGYLRGRLENKLLNIYNRIRIKK